MVSLFGIVNSATYYISESDTIHEKYDIRPDEINDLIANRLIEGDSILFKRGERFFTHINYFKAGLNYITFASYGDTLLSKPIIDGSVFHFEFDVSTWNDFEMIKGVKFYKKTIKGLDQVENIYADDAMLTLSREPDEDETLIQGMKNSFTGYFKIDSVDTSYHKKIFYDRSNATDWGDAELITRVNQWRYEVLNFSNKGGKYVCTDEPSAPLKKGNGYFVQRSKKALDHSNEWYYDKENGILYFNTDKEKCTVYISSNSEDDNAGIDIKRRKGVVVEDLEFRNAKYGIKLENSFDLLIENCSFRNSVYGIANKKTYVNNCLIRNNKIRNMRSYGIRIVGNDTKAVSNSIDSIGMILGCESKEFNNLNGIEVFGNNSLIINNTITNTGYCGIRIFDAAGSKVIDNYIENAMHLLSDGGGIYSYHNLDGNKIIKRNKIVNVHGSAKGTQGDDNGSNGIYLDEFSFHFKVDSNIVYKCGGGIYLQNSRMDTITNNILGDNNTTELHLNHAGRILNGGELNPSDDPAFNPDTLRSIPEDYFWDTQEGILYYKVKPSGIIYIRPGDNIISDNFILPNNSKYSIQFRTWQNIDDDLIEKLTGFEDFFERNIHEEYLRDTGVYILGMNIEGNTKVRDRITKSLYDNLREVKVYIWKGKKVKLN